MIINFIIIYIKVMNKFSKTSYSRPSTHNRNPNYNNFVQSSQDKRDKLYSRQNKSNLTKKISSNDLQSYPITQQIQQQIVHNQQPLHNLIQKKIQIDPTLLFTYKAHSKNQNRLQKPKKIVKNYQRNFSETATDGFPHRSQERPQSKQESRTKFRGGNSGVTKITQAERPQTSKGVRTKAEEEKGKKGNMDQDNKINVEIKKSKHPQSATSKRSQKVRQIELQTSIDPQFLSLFAS